MTEQTVNTELTKEQKLEMLNSIPVVGYDTDYDGCYVAVADTEQNRALLAQITDEHIEAAEGELDVAAVGLGLADCFDGKLFRNFTDQEKIDLLNSLTVYGSDGDGDACYYVKVRIELAETALEMLGYSEEYIALNTVEEDGVRLIDVAPIAWAHGAKYFDSELGGFLDHNPMELDEPDEVYEGVEIAIGHDVMAVIINRGSIAAKELNGVYCEDNNFENVPEATPGTVFRCKVAYFYTPGTYEYPHEYDERYEVIEAVQVYPPLQADSSAA